MFCCSKEILTAPFHKCFSPFVYFYSLLSLSKGIYMFSSSTICTFVFGGQILCLRIFHTVLSGCLLNKYPISNSLARFPSVQYMVLFSNSNLSCLINYVYIYVHLYIVSSDIFQNPCSSMLQSNNSLNHSVSSISSIALAYILYKLFNYIDVW